MFFIFDIHKLGRVVGLNKLSASGFIHLQFKNKFITIKILFTHQNVKHHPIHYHYMKFNVYIPTKRKIQMFRISSSKKVSFIH